MKWSLLWSSVFLLVSATPAIGQHGVAEPGYYPPKYQGDTWSGNIAAVDETTREITLRHANGKTFVGILIPGYVVSGPEGKPRELLMSELSLGARVKCYYLRNAVDFHLPRHAPFKAFGFLSLQQPEPPRRPFNLIFLMKSLPDDLERWTGIVTAVNEAAREISITEAHGTNPKTLVGMLTEGYRFRRKDGSFYNLRVSEIPLGTHLTVYFVPEKSKKGEKLNRIYGITFLRGPQDK